MRPRSRVAEAGAATLEFLKEHIAEPRTVPLCGNSIGMDRRFLSAPTCPEIEEFLHYRSVDVSTIKELARRWYPADLAEPSARRPRHTGRWTTSRSRSPSCATGASRSSAMVPDAEAAGRRRPAGLAGLTGYDRSTCPHEEDATEVAPAWCASPAPDHAAGAGARELLRARGRARGVTLVDPGLPGPDRATPSWSDGWLRAASPWSGCTPCWSPTRTPTTSAGPVG